MEMRPDRRAVDKLYKRRDRYEIPEFQRDQVWDLPRKQKLIDTMLRGWKLPKFYFLKTADDPEEFEVVDGQQRLAAIWEFCDNQLPLSQASAERFGGTYYRDLPEGVADKFDDYEIEFDVIEDANEADVKEFFQRLQMGLPLTSSEKLNSVHSGLRDFARKLSKHRFFKEKVVASNRRYGHFDIMCKAAAVEIEGLDVGLRYEDLEGVFASQTAFSTRSAVATRLSASLDFLDAAFETRSPDLRNRSVVQSLITLTARLVSPGAAAGFEHRLSAFFGRFMAELSRQVTLGRAATDPDYLQFQRTVNANVRSGVRLRHEVMLRRLMVFDPELASLLGPQAVAESGLTAQIRRDADAIANLIADLNHRYAGDHGEDLFKPTNKTVQAQVVLATPVTTLGEYKELVDNLYFIFHEGVGQRLAGREPQSFTDVSLLRTDIDHDVNHGQPVKVRAKRQRIAQTFARYSGVRSPQALAPEVFAVVQANLLYALRRDLEALSP